MVLRRLAYYGETWLAEHFNAYLADPDEHRAWRSGERSCSPAPRPDTCPGFGRFRDDDDRQHPPSPHRLPTRPKNRVRAVRFRDGFRDRFDAEFDADEVMAVCRAVPGVEDQVDDRHDRAESV